MQINFYRLIAPALCMIILFLAGWKLLDTVILVMVSVRAIMLLHRKDESTEIRSTYTYNDKLLPSGMGFCFNIPIKGKTPLQTLTYNRKFNSGTEIITRQKNSRV